MNANPSDGKNLYDVFYVLFKRKYMLVAVSVATVVGMLFGTYLARPLWKATAKVWVQYNPKQQLTMQEGITTPGSTVPGVNPAGDVVEMLTSRQLAEEIAKRCGRDKLWETRRTNPQSTRDILLWYLQYVFIEKPMDFLAYVGVLTPNPENYLADAVKELLQDLEDIEQEADTTVVSCTIWGESPEIATAMTNTLVELLLEQTKEASRDPIEKMIRETEAQAAKAEENLRKAQNDLRRFKETTGVVLYAEEAEILLNRLDRYDADLKSLESQVIALRVAKGPEHPEVKALEARIAEYRGKFVPEVELDLKELPVKEVELAMLSQEVEVRKAMHSSLKQKQLELEALRNSTTGDLDIKVIDAARVYSFVTPDWPKWVINIPLSLLAGLIAGIGFVSFVEYWNTSFKSVKQLEETTPFVVLGGIPKLARLQKRRMLSLLRAYTNREEPAGRMAEFSERSWLPFGAETERLADAIGMRDGRGRGKVIVVTSASYGEGKSTITALLAAVMAARGKKVLVVEANLRTPSLRKLLPPGKAESLCLAHLAPDGASSDQMIPAQHNLDIVFADSGERREGRNSAGAPLAVRIKKLLEEIREKYDYVFVDTPCLKKFNDALVLGSMSDRVLLVVEANETPRRTVLMAAKRLEAAGARIEGLVLNKQVNYVPEFIQSLLD